MLRDTQLAAESETHSLSQLAFKTVFDDHVASAKRLNQTYATLKPGDPDFVLKAAARTGVANLSVVWMLTGIPIPHDMDHKDMYCSMLNDRLKAPARVAKDAFDYCTNNAAAHDLDGSMCNPVPEGFPQVVP